MFSALSSKSLNASSDLSSGSSWASVLIESLSLSSITAMAPVEASHRLCPLFCFRRSCKIPTSGHADPLLQFDPHVGWHVPSLGARKYDFVKFIAWFWVTGAYRTPANLQWVPSIFILSVFLSISFHASSLPSCLMGSVPCWPHNTSWTWNCSACGSKVSAQSQPYLGCTYTMPHFLVERN